MDADDHQAAVLVLLIPGLDIGQRTQAVDAGIGPEIDQDYFPPKRLRGERRRVNPASSSGKIGKDGGHAVRSVAGDVNRLIDYDSFCGGMEAVDQVLLQAGGTGQGKTGKHAAIQSEGGGGHSSQNGHAEYAANPLLRAQRTLHGGEDAATGEQGNRQ